MYQNFALNPILSMYIIPKWTCLTYNKKHQVTCDIKPQKIFHKIQSRPNDYVNFNQLVIS